MDVVFHYHFDLLTCSPARLLLNPLSQAQVVSIMEREYAGSVDLSDVEEGESDEGSDEGRVPTPCLLRKAREPWTEEVM